MDTLYRARFETPDLIEQGRANTLSCRVYRDGGPVAPDSGTVSVYDAAGIALVSAATVTVSGLAATYSLLAATVASSPRGEGWRVEWALTMPDGVVHTFRNDAALVLRRLYPVATEQDLYRICSTLDPTKPACIHSEASFDDKLDEAFTQIELMLIDKGQRPNLIMSPSSLRMCQAYLTLALIFEDFATRLTPAYLETGKDYRSKFVAAWGELRFVYDSRDTGQPDGGPQGRRKSATPSMWLTSRGNNDNGGGGWPV